jgi:hypothetical protein
VCGRYYSLFDKQQVANYFHVRRITGQVCRTAPRQSSWSLEYVSRQFLQGQTTRREQHASYPPKVIHVNPLNSPLKLLNQKRSSALIDARRIEAKLTRLSNSAATAGRRTNLVCIVGMFRDYIATLDEAIAISVVKLRELSALPN